MKLDTHIRVIEFHSLVGVYTLTDWGKRKPLSRERRHTYCPGTVLTCSRCRWFFLSNCPILSSARDPFPLAGAIKKRPCTFGTLTDGLASYDVIIRSHIFAD
jgi:hypothetical protein